jgi:hypothetical protein
MQEAITLCGEIARSPWTRNLDDNARRPHLGISATRHSRATTRLAVQYDVRGILEEIHAASNPH